MGTGFFPRVKCGRGVLLTTHPLLALRSWKSRAIPLPTLWATTGPVTGSLYLLFIFRNVLFTWKRRRPAERVSARHTGHGIEENNNIIVLLTTLLNHSHLPLVPRLRMNGARPLLPTYAFVTCTVTTLLSSFLYSYQLSILPSVGDR